MIGQAGQTFEYQRPAELAFREVAVAMSHIGKVKSSNPSTLTLIGSTRYGLQRVNLRVSVQHSGEGRSLVTVSGAGDDIWGAASRKAADKLIAALR